MVLLGGRYALARLALSRRLKGTPIGRPLWWAEKGNWQKAHECAQAQDDATGAWVHACLHREEGDLANAGYWYARAGKPVAAGPLAVERDEIVRALLYGT